MTRVPIKEKVGPPTCTINHLSVPSNTIELESLVFPKKIGLARFKYVINIKFQIRKNQKLAILNNLLKKTFHLKNYPKVFMNCLQMHA
jgi:hypothetical protein